MPLPAPNLDDRRFQDLVDDAKRLVQQRCPEWTDHNVSDPGVTLIEAFAQMVDQLIYRLNRVPDRHYVKFLDLIGVQLFPPTAATGAVTFWLAAPQPAAVVVRARDRGRDPAHGHRGAGRLRHHRRAAGRAVRAAPRRHPGSGRGRGRRDHQLGNGQLPLLLGGATARRHAAHRAVQRRSRPARSCCASTARSVASASIPGTRRSSGRRGTARPGPRARSNATTTGGFNRPGDVILHVPAIPPGLGHRPAAGRLAALPGRAGRCQPARLHRDPGDRRHPRLHDRRHASASCTPRPSTTKYSGPPTVRRVSGSRCSATRSSPPIAPPCCTSATRRQTAAGWTGCPSLISPGRPSTIGTTSWTRSPARCSSGQRSGSLTAGCASTARYRRRAAPSGCPLTGWVAAAAGTWPAARSGCSRPAFPTWRGSRTVIPPPAESKGRPSRTLNCAARWSFGRAAAP